MDRRAFLDSLLVIDGHCDSALDLVGLSYSNPGGMTRDLLSKSEWGHIDYPRLASGKVGAQIFALFADDAYVDHAKEHTWMLLRAMEELWSRGGPLVPARSSGDILSARSRGELACILSIEGGEAIGDSQAEGLAELRAFYERGVRLMGLTWNRRNALGRGAGTGNPAVDGSGGLTDFGRAVVKEMERLGMVVDASHLSDEALEDLLAVAERPVVASHSNSREITPHRRNLTDRQAERIAATGGLIGLCFAGVFLDPDPAKVSKAKALEHLERLIAVAGPEHVGLGSDFDGFTKKFGVAFGGPEELPWIAEALLDKGYSEDVVRKVMGENWLRVLREIIG